MTSEVPDTAALANVIADALDEHEPPRPGGCLGCSNLWNAASAQEAAVAVVEHLTKTGTLPARSAPLTPDEITALADGPEVIVWATIIYHSQFPQVWRGLVTISGYKACPVNGDSMGGIVQHPLSALSDVYLAVDPLAEIR